MNKRIPIKVLPYFEVWRQQGEETKQSPLEKPKKSTFRKTGEGFNGIIFYKPTI